MEEKISEPKKDVKEETKIEDIATITKKDLDDFSKNLTVAFDNMNKRLTMLEQKQNPAVLPQQTQQQDAMSNPIVQLLLQQALKSEESGSFGTAENKEFFAQVGKADFDSFRLMQQRRFIKLMEKVSKE